MIKKYIMERKSWIFFFLFMQLFILFVSYLDAAISLRSAFYIVFLLTIMLILFVIVRYKKETKFYKSLEEWESDLDLSNVLHAESPFEKMVESTLVNQTNLLKQSAWENRVSLEEEKDELLSWIHEVKTPLTAMHLIIERVEEEKIKSQLSYEWLRIHMLLDQQLHQKRIPFMENDLYIEHVELKPLIFKEIKALQSWCMQKGIGFDIELEVPSVLSDAKWLSFIIRQILTNAVKYSESSDIVIKSSMQKGHVQLEIRDFGRGIDPKDLPRIFDKGFTSTTAHQDQAATGMGLYLAKKAAEPLLIDIDVQSQLHEGTTFTITFPEKNEFVRITGM
ncbi:histidine kinase-, DNA gyrase B-, and HSP90-like ATPase family protein [Anoxybacillus sp. B7M1]|uniref:sensor histidine kinase n=1 Tax=unclassified Anoxybacillus TaxID=2639704 RepID=UPI0005CCB6B2|nr:MULTISPECIES: sensor histidine kinase [unclassified Anoxybacillus]ANB56433.1 histidine kinase-, DNA gyrase B-, and HSP90-like ATPase family protein [Anoxybacillus sp. B2M1]ANB63078.1 histidine kinase-, DNA gyrase B-, and HSP90-like ATPase family protein [Anoxybacillus sp. B7M1]